MKKVSLFFLAILFAFASQSQNSEKLVNGDTINKKDAQGRKQGQWEENDQSILY